MVYISVSSQNSYVEVLTLKVTEVDGIFGKYSGHGVGVLINSFIPLLKSSYKAHVAL